MTKTTRPPEAGGSYELDTQTGRHSRKAHTRPAPADRDLPTPVKSGAAKPTGPATKPDKKETGK